MMNSYRHLFHFALKVSLYQTPGRIIQRFLYINTISIRNRLFPIMYTVNISKHTPRGRHHRLGKHNAVDDDDDD
ncbi:unnamed protein product, partial [Heterobilharzia americana]